MKILSLEIENIASVKQKTFLNFAEGPLAIEPIFLITGKTGSGKTTILNSICVALYNAVPALEAQDNKKGDVNDINVKSPEQLVRRDAKKAHIELIFEAGNHKYCAHWEKERVKTRNGSLKFKGDHTVKGVCHDFFAKNSEVPKAVVELTGYTFDQFCRTSMLAQGQFLKFLSSSIKDKSDILEKLTGTEIYSKIGTSIYNRFSAIEKKKSELESEIKGARLLSDKEISDCQAAIQAGKEKQAKADAELSLLAPKKKWIEDEHKAQTALKDAQTKLETINTEEQLAKIDAARKICANWDDTLEIRNIIATLSTAQDSYNKAQARLLQLLPKYNEYTAGASSLSVKKSQTAKQIEENSAKQQAMSRFVPMIEIAGEINAAIDEVLASEKKKSSEQTKLTKSSAELKNMQESIKEQATDIDAKQKEADKFAEETNQALKETEKHDIKKISNEIQALNSALSVANDAKNRLQKVAERTQTLAEKNDEANKLQINIAENTKAQESALASVDSLLKESEAAKNRLDGKADLSEKLALLTSVFADEKKCPLCGSQVDGLLARDVINDEVAAAQREYDDARKKYNEQLSAAAQLKSKIASDTANIGKLQGEINKLDKDINNEKTQIGVTLQQLGIACADEDANSALDKKIEGINQQQNLQKTNLENASRAISNYKRLSANLEEKLRLLEKTKSDLVKKQQAAADKQGEINACARLIKEYDDNIARKNAWLANNLKIDYSPTDLPAAKQKLAEIRKQHTALLDEVTRLSQQLSTTSNTISAVQAALNSLHDKFGEADTMEPREVADLESKARSLVHDAATISGEAASYANAITASRQQEEAYYRTNDRQQTEAKILSLGSLTAKDIETAKAGIKDFELAVAGAKGEVNAQSQLLEQLCANKPDDMPQEDAAAAVDSLIAAATDARESAIKSQAEEQSKLQINENNKKAHEATILELEKTTIEYLKWKDLNDVFGGSDGMRFRKKAQTLLFSHLLERANYYLRQLTPRYVLETDLNDENMLIYVVDRWDNDSKRIANSLSGGEGFIASLALALGLSSVSTEKDQCDVLFIDEGFGTLDSALLKEVIDMLSSLQRGTGRKVGVISHMDLLAEKIPTQIKVERAENDSYSIIHPPK